MNMKTLMFVSTETFTGKTGICLSVAEKLIGQGNRVGYMKPVGNLPTRAGDILTDKDARFASTVLGRKEDLADLCPLPLTSRETDKFLRGEAADYKERVTTSFRRLSQDKSMMILEGSAHINDGKLFGLSAPQVAELLGASTVLVGKFVNPYEMVDDILVARERFGGRFAGVILNWVKPEHQMALESLVLPFLSKQGIPVFGMIPKEDRLLAIKISELVDLLGGEVLCAEDHLDDMIETFMVGAMGQELALRFFARKADKAVITGGDRADIQLAALETPTKCLILTGNYYPSASVLGVAESKGVPMIKVDMDTLTAVQTTESLVGRQRVHDKRVLAEIAQLVERNVDLERLGNVFDIAQTA